MSSINNNSLKSQDAPGVVEGRPGIIETTHIDPLDENSLNRDEFPKTEATGQGLMNTATNVASGAATMAGGAARYAYGAAVGDETHRKAGEETLFGK